MRSLKPFLLLAVMSSFLISGCWPHQAGPTEVGVRTVKFGIFKKRGVEEKYYAPGKTYFFMPIINDWHTFDTKLQTMEMTFDPKRGDLRARDDLLFKTIDGNDISLDVIIQYRIDPMKAPNILQNVAEDDFLLRQKVVRTVVRSVPRDVFGELKTEDFYISGQRQEKAEKVQESLNSILEPLGVIITRVSTKDYRFPPAYQQAIEDRKVADQQAEKNKSQAKAAEEEYRRKVADGQGQVNRVIAEADGEFERAKLEADAYFQQQGQIAKAIEAEGLADAAGIRAMNRALTGSGGEALVKLRIAEALKGKKIYLLPVSEGGINLKTTDINDLLKVYGLQSMAKRAAPAPQAEKPAEAK
ncbi:MAG: SPFH domain-containing protein [bacterium]|nr:SPFH domain-containing protein [bacterium]MDT8395342.1 SPFH domain-containing protein [bacterium]